MNERIQQKFALSPEGAKDFLHSCFWSGLLNIALLLPAMFSFWFLQSLLPTVRGEAESTSFTVPVALATAAFLSVIMFAVALKQYDATYSKIYNESALRRISLAEKLRKLPLAFFGKRDVADLSSTIMEDATQLETLFSHVVPQLYSSVVSTALISLMLLAFHWKMALAVLWVVPVAYSLFFLSRRFQKRAHRDLFQAKRAISDALQEGLDSIQEIKAYQYEETYLEQWNRRLDQYESKLISMELLIGAMINFSYTWLKLGLVSVVFFGALLYGAGQVDLFTYIVFMILSAGIYHPFLRSLDDMAALIYLNTRIERFKEMDSMPIQEGRTEFSPRHYDIVFEDVRFSYLNDRETIRGVSFTAKQGEVTALVGPSGGGKSTVAKLAARFWDIDQGKITLGGEDISEIDPETLLGSFSIVFQDVILFNRSVLENIRIGRKDASDEEVLRAAALAECDEFAERLPEGYDTVIGENGERLSGGERQRISIARAILKDAPIVLLDEATASLDAENERKIQQALSALVKNKTVLMIAHRMRTVMEADQILVIDQGNIVERGAPKALLKAGGHFAAMNAMR